MDLQLQWQKPDGALLKDTSFYPCASSPIHMCERRYGPSRSLPIFAFQDSLSLSLSLFPLCVKGLRGSINAALISAGTIII